MIVAGLLVSIVEFLNFVLSVFVMLGLNDNHASRSGKIKNLDKFDNTYFCTLQILAESMEPGSRIILETTYEAIADAGIAPQSIRGSKTGVYVGINTVGKLFIY